MPDLQTMRHPTSVFRMKTSGPTLSSIACRILSLAALLLPCQTARSGDLEMLSSNSPPSGAENAWRFAIEFYGWGPSIDATLSNGIEIDLGFDDVFDDLRMAALFSVGASRGRWSFGTDVIYLDLAVSESGVFTSDPILGSFVVTGSAKVDVDVKTWIANPVAGYRLYEADWGHLDILAGGRYLYLREEVDISVNGRLELHGKELLASSGKYHTGGSSGFWAAIGGIKGRIELPGAWHAPFYFDVGTGDADLTWQAFVGIAYEMNRFDVVLGYRHLDWDFGSSNGLSELEVSGPMLGIKMAF
jgi:hypothetical protein